MTDGVDRAVEMAASLANSQARRRGSDVASRSPRGTLLAEPRRMKILEWLQEEGSARVKDPSVAFSVSEATVRQDLERLEAEGSSKREHGGAFLKSLPQQVQAMALHHLVNMDRKRKIGRVSFSSLGGLELVHVFITDDGIRDQDRWRLEEAGVKVQIAS